MKLVLLNRAMGRRVGGDALAPPVLPSRQTRRSTGGYRAIYCVDKVVTLNRTKEAYGRTYPRRCRPAVRGAPDCGKARPAGGTLRAAGGADALSGQARDRHGGGS